MPPLNAATVAADPNSQAVRTLGRHIAGCRLSSSSIGGTISGRDPRQPSLKRARSPLRAAPFSAAQSLQRAQSKHGWLSRGPR